jgi:thiamine monophosphate synthase
LPLAAIGGIELSNVAQVRAAACCAICVCRAVIGEPDAAQAAARLKAAMREGGEAGVAPS